MPHSKKFGVNFKNVESIEIVYTIYYKTYISKRCTNVQKRKTRRRPGRVLKDKRNMKQKNSNRKNKTVVSNKNGFESIV